MLQTSLIYLEHIFSPINKESAKIAPVRAQVMLNETFE